MSCLVKAPDYMLILAKVVCLTDLIPVMTPFSFSNYLILSDAPILQQVSTHVSLHMHCWPQHCSNSLLLPANI